MNRWRVTAIAVLAAALVGAVVFHFVGWGAATGALMGAVGGLSAAIGWYWGNKE